MSLDANLFTLNFAPSKDDANVTDLVDPLDNPHYRKERVPGTDYRINVYEPLSQSLLASATAPHPTSKVKLIELHNPAHVVELKYTGTISFKWRFMWEEHEFEWRREECFIIREPDPAVLVAVTKEPSGRIRTSSVQILDYNLNRFDINDRKGLEIVILTALLTFQDSNEAHHLPAGSNEGSGPATTRPAFFGTSRRPSETQEAAPAPPALPPKPPPRVGAARIAEVHAVHAAQGEGEANEVEVADDGTVEEYAEYAEGLLLDDAMLFVTIRSATAAHVPKVLQVVEHTKRLRHKAGLDEAQELFQYVIYDTEKKGPKRINLDDPSPSHMSYAPPTSLKIHLSKIDIPELRPRAEKSTRVTPTKSRPSLEPAKLPEPPVIVDATHTKQKGNEKERQRIAEEERKRERERAKEMEKAQKKAEKEAKKLDKNKKNPAVHKLTKAAVVVPPSGPVNDIPNARPAPPRPGPYQTPSGSSYPSFSPSFPQPEHSVGSAASFYSGASFNMNLSPGPSTLPPLSHSRSSSTFHNANPPPAHPAHRPRSLYGTDLVNSTPYAGYSSAYRPQ